MYFKQLELIGFKSFAAKTTFEFPAGVTSIVGPNGSGKSNIIDAIRWILGERDAKNIRAERSESLIFSGTSGRTRAGFAQVTITFDNSTHFFPLDFSEISIRRRVERDGTSKYFINDSEVRLRDIIDFYARARLGTKGFGIINQGNSDLFIRANPNERRLMLEEVLGLRQYQLKRRESENKLESTRINLEKVDALIEELLPHLRLLRRQAGKWEKHATIETELKELENHYFGLKLRELETEETRIAPELQKLEEKIKAVKKELEERSRELEKVEKGQPSLGKLPSAGSGQRGTGKADAYEDFKKQQVALFNRRSQIQKELGRFEAELEFLVSRPKVSAKEAELVEMLKQAHTLVRELGHESDLVVIKKKLQELATKLESLLEGGSKEVKDRQKEIGVLKDKFVSELEELEKNLASLGNLEQKLATEMREFNTVFKKAFEAVEQKKEELNQLETHKQRLGFEKERLNDRRQDLANQAFQYGRAMSEFQSAKTVEGVEEMGAMEKRMLRLRGELASIGEIDQALLKEAQGMEERYAFLSTQSADLKKASADLKQLIIQLREKIHFEFTKSLHAVNEEFNKYFRLMFNGGKAKLHLVKKERLPTLLAEAESGVGVQGAVEAVDVEAIEEEKEEFEEGGLEIELNIPRKNIKGLDMLSGGERSLVSIAVLFALISVSPPPFLVLDEVDAALDENNTKRFATLVKDFSKHTQFIIVTHNRSTMEAASILYGVTMGDDGTSRLLSLRLDEVPAEMTAR